MKFTHVAFDLDGTIYDSLGANMRAMYELEKQLHPDTKETYESLLRFAGIPAAVTLKELGYAEEQYDEYLRRWCEGVKNYAGEIKIFDGVLPVIRYLHKRGVKLGIVTSRDRGSAERMGDIGSILPFEIKPYFSQVVCCDDTKRGKPWPDPLLRYLEISRASPDEVLFIGDTDSDQQCAQAAGVAFGLALWGYLGGQSIRCDYYFSNPWEIVNAVTAIPDGMGQKLKWIMEIQAIAQVGKMYTKDRFDEERFVRLQEITLEMLHELAPEEVERNQAAFLPAQNFPCPKMDTRAAIFNEKDEILLVHEKGRWSLPGGWCDDDQTIVSNTLKEVREEAGMDACPKKLIALLDRNRHNAPPYTYVVIRVFLECIPGEWHFVKNIETTDCRYFAEDQLPLEDLRTGTTTEEQLRMCFEAHRSPDWKCIVE